MKIENLIKEYEGKIKGLDMLVEQATTNIQEIRHKHEYTTDDYHNATADFAEERRIASAKRQLMVQFIEDLKSLDTEQPEPQPQEEQSDMINLSAFINKYITGTDELEGMPVYVDGEDKHYITDAYGDGDGVFCSNWWISSYPNSDTGNYCDTSRLQVNKQEALNHINQ